MMDNTAKDIHTFRGSIALHLDTDELPACTLGSTNMSWHDLGKMIKTYHDFNFKLNIQGGGHTLTISHEKPHIESAANDVITAIR